MSNHESTMISASNGDYSLDKYVQELDLPTYAVCVEPSFSFPLIRYAKGVLVVSGKKPAKVTAFHIGTEQSAELDSLLESQGAPIVRVRHKSGNEETYWQLESLKGYMLFKAIPENYSPDAWQKTGMPYIWNDYQETYSYGSQLQILFFLTGLLDLGYTQPLVLSFSRTVTEHVITKVLQRQAAMLETLKKALKRHGKPAELASYAYWLELVKGEEVTVKKGGSYFAPAITMPSSLTVGYVTDHQAAAAHLEIIEAFIPLWSQWAEAASTRLLQPPHAYGIHTRTQELEPEADPTGAFDEAE